MQGNQQMMNFQEKKDLTDGFLKDLQNWYKNTDGKCPICVLALLAVIVS